MLRISVGIWFEFNFYMHKMSFDCRLLQANESLRELSVVQGMSAEQLYKEHAPQLLDSFGESYVHWTNHSVERLIFDTLLIYSGERKVISSFLHNCEFHTPRLCANFHVIDIWLQL